LYAKTSNANGPRVNGSRAVWSNESASDATRSQHHLLAPCTRRSLLGICVYFMGRYRNVRGDATLIGRGLQGALEAANELLARQYTAFVIYRKRIQITQSLKMKLNSGTRGESEVYYRPTGSSTSKYPWFWGMRPNTFRGGYHHIHRIRASARVWGPVYRKETLSATPPEFATSRLCH
jgi:hypothetical protein